MAACASALAVEDRLAPRRVSIGRRAAAESGHGAQIGEDGPRLKIAEVVGWHRRAWDAVLNGPDYAVFGGRAAKLAVSQIDAVNQGTFRAMTGDAVGAEQFAAIFDVRGSEAVLREKWEGDARRRSQDAHQPHLRHTAPAFELRGHHIKVSMPRSRLIYSLVAGRYSFWKGVLTLATKDLPLFLGHRWHAFAGCHPGLRSSFIYRRIRR